MYLHTEYEAVTRRDDGQDQHPPHLAPAQRVHTNLGTTLEISRYYLDNSFHHTYLEYYDSYCMRLIFVSNKKYLIILPPCPLTVSISGLVQEEG